MMTTFNGDINAMIALRIFQAQKASDAGKGLERLNASRDISRPCDVFRYGFKEKPILEALRLIRRNKTQFNYWVVEGPDQNGYPSIIVYFDFKIEGTRYQVSFHNPLNRCGNELLSYVNTGRATRWRKSISSVESCNALQRYYNIPEAKSEEYICEDDSDRKGSHRNRRKPR